MVTWGYWHEMVNERDPNSIEDRATTGGYPQINLNTGISFGALALLIGMVIYTVSIKSDVAQLQALLNYHEQRIVATESALKDVRASADAVRYAQSQSDIKLEGRLSTIEGMLRDLLGRRPNP